MTEQTIRLFVSSPGDVEDERGRVGDVVRRLNAAFAGRVRIEPVLWGEHFYSAHADFQSQIPAAILAPYVENRFLHRHIFASEGCR